MSVPSESYAPPVVEVDVGTRLEAAEYRRLRAAVGWSTPPADDAALQAALDRTWNVVAREAGALVGMGRLLDDGALYATVWDMIVVPEAQRRGIGAAILRHLLERAEDRTIVALVATAAARDLYERFGFRDEDGGGTGMFLRPSR